MRQPGFNPIGGWFKVITATWDTLVKALVVLLSITATACADGSIKWTEDVILPDGRLVVLNRYEEFKGGAEIGSGRFSSGYWFEFIHPDTKKTIRWNGKPDLPTVLLHIDGSRTFVVLKPDYSATRFLDCPIPPYQLFELVKGEWVWKPLEQLTIRTFRSNMTMSAGHWRDALKGSNPYLSAAVTQDLQYNWKPFVIDLSRMTSQQFVDGRPFVFDPQKLEGVRSSNNTLCLNFRQKEWLRSE